MPTRTRGARGAADEARAPAGGARERTSLENPTVTRALVDQAAEALEKGR